MSADERAEECPHRRWISHGGWFRCAECPQELPRFRDGAQAIAAMRLALRGPKSRVRRKPKEVPPWGK